MLPNLSLCTPAPAPRAGTSLGGQGAGCAPASAAPESEHACNRTRIQIQLCQGLPDVAHLPARETVPGSPASLTLPCLLRPVLKQENGPCQPRALPAPGFSPGMVVAVDVPPLPWEGCVGASATGQTCLAKSTLCKEGDPGGLPLAQTHGSPHPGWAGSPSKPHCSAPQPSPTSWSVQAPAMPCATGRANLTTQGSSPCLAPSPPLWKRRMLRHPRSLGRTKTHRHPCHCLLACPFATQAGGWV